MPRFQSRLFNWIDRSLPVQMGRSARRWWLELQAGGWQSDRSFWGEADLALNQGFFPRITRIAITPFRKATNFLVGIFKRPPSQLSGASPAQPIASAPVHPLLSPAVEAIAALVRTFGRAISLENPFPNSKLSSKLTLDLAKAAVSENVGANGEAIALADQLAPELPNSQSSPIQASESWLERIQRLLKAAIAYFLDRDIRRKKLTTHPNSNQMAKSQAEPLTQTANEPWLTMSDLFSDDHAPWPPVAKKLEISSSPTRQLTAQGSLTVANPEAIAVSAPQTTGLQTTGTSSTTLTTGQLTTIEQWAVADMIDLEDLGRETKDSPLRAWIETQATFLGYAYDPVMAIVHWCDRLIARLERSLIWCLQNIRKLMQKILGNS